MYNSFCLYKNNATKNEFYIPPKNKEVKFLFSCCYNFYYLGNYLFLKKANFLLHSGCQLLYIGAFLALQLKLDMWLQQLAKLVVFYQHAI